MTVKCDGSVYHIDVDEKSVECVVKNQNKTCNVTLVTYQGVLEFDPQMRLSCDFMTLELCLWDVSKKKFTETARGGG